MNTYNNYKYMISLSYIKDNEEIVFDHKNIITMTIDYDYDKKNMPIILMRLGIDKSVLDHMIKNKDKTIILNISKFKDSDGINIRKTIIKGEFFYFLDNNINYLDDLDYADDNNKQNEDLYKTISLGLMKKDLILNNKVLINTVYKDTYLLDIICEAFSKKNIVIEPFVKDIYIDNLIVHPIESLSKFIAYLNDRYTLYESPYRLFFDFNKTYLLSSSGKGVPIKNEKFNSVFIYINNTITQESKVQGMSEDDKLKAYVVYVDSSSINISIDNVTTLSYNQIIGIDSEGNSKTIDLDSDVDGKRYKIARINNDNLEFLNNIKKSIETNKIVINIIKEELDSEVFSLNKEYYIKSYNKLADKDGRFLLSAKKEVYIKEAEAFTMTSILTLKKCPST